MRVIVEKKTDRYIWVDIYKGVAIILVVLGHLEIPEWLYGFIFLFHMYAFFFISGVTFQVKNNQNFGNFLKENIVRLYVPYLFFAFAWDIVHIVSSLYIQGDFDLSLFALLKNIVSILIGGGLFSSNAELGPAWFLLALFVVRTISWLIIKLSNNNRYWFGAIAVALFALGYFVRGNSILPFKIESALTGLLFVFLGYCMKDTIHYVSAQRKTGSLLILALVGFGVVALLSAFVDTTVILVSNVLPENWIYTILGGFFGCVGMLSLSFLLERVQRISTYIAFFGVNSLIIMGIHSEINFAMRFVFHILHFDSVMRPVLIFAITLLLSVPICVIINKYFPILAGKRKRKV